MLACRPLHSGSGALSRLEGDGDAISLSRSARVISPTRKASTWASSCSAVIGSMIAASKDHSAGIIVRAGVLACDSLFVHHEQVGSSRTAPVSIVPSISEQRVKSSNRVGSLVRYERNSEGMRCSSAMTEHYRTGTESLRLGFPADLAFRRLAPSGPRVSRVFRLHHKREIKIQGPSFRPSIEKEGPQWAVINTKPCGTLDITNRAPSNHAATRTCCPLGEQLPAPLLFLPTHVLLMY